MNFFHHIANSFVASAPSAGFVTANLQAYWDANVGSGSTIWNDLHQTYNATPYTYNLGLSNGAAFTTIGGVNAVYFDGVNDVAGVGTRPQPPDDPLIASQLLNYTNELWIRSNGAWLNQGNFWAAAYNQGSRCRWQSNAVRIYAPNTDTFTTAYGGTAVWTQDVWHHMVVTMENLGANDRISVYRNGVLVGQDTTGNYAPTLVVNDFYLATWNGAGELQRMYAGLVRRYNAALTAAEVLQNFNAEKSRFGY
jgi:hypothetical protein